MKKTSLMILAFALTILGLNAHATKIGDDTLILTKSGSSADKIMQFGGRTDGLIKYNKSLNRVQTSANGGTFKDMLSGGGGGGSMIWIETPGSPIASTDSVGNRIYLFTSGLAQTLNTVVKVPSAYAGGNQFKINVLMYSPDSSGTVLLQTVSTLNRTGTDAFTSTTNQRTSTNTAITLGAGTVNIPQLVTLDLTDSSGNINGVPITGNSSIFVSLKRGTDTATSDVSAMIYTSELLTQ